MALRILSAWSRRWYYSVENRGAGRLVYREGNHEYIFPAYEESGELVLAGIPSSQRVHLFFNWYPSRQELTEPVRERIVTQLVEHLTEAGASVRLFERAAGGFEHYSELADCRERAMDLLDSEGYLLFRDYGSIEPLPEEHGLEISGIRDWRAVKPMLAALERAFPHWHHQKACRDGEAGGWSVALSMFPMHAAHSEWNDGSVSD